MKRVLLVVLIIVCLTTGVLMFANSAFAQAVIAVAQLNGTVRDTSGSVVANASVSLRNLDTNRTYTSSSDASGYYIVPNLPPGSYELNATYAGFEPYVQSGIQLMLIPSARRGIRHRNYELYYLGGELRTTGAWLQSRYRALQQMLKDL